MTRKLPSTIGRLAGLAAALSLVVAGLDGLLAQSEPGAPADGAVEAEPSDDAGVPSGAAAPDGGPDRSEDSNEMQDAGDEDWRHSLARTICGDEHVGVHRGSLGCTEPYLGSWDDPDVATLPTTLYFYPDVFDPDDGERVLVGIETHPSAATRMDRNRAAFYGSESSGWRRLDHTELDASNCRTIRPPDHESVLLCADRRPRTGYSKVRLTAVRTEGRSIATRTVIGFSEGGCHMYKNCGPKDVTEGTIDLEGVEVASRTAPYRIVVPFEVDRVTEQEDCEPSAPGCLPHYRPTSKGPSTFDVTYYQTEHTTVELRFELVDGRLELVTDDEPKAEGFRFRLESPD